MELRGAADGGFRPAYNVQFACDTTSGAIAKVSVDKGPLKGRVDLHIENVENTVQAQINSLNNIIRQKPDAILLDLMLPRVDGWAVIDSLHQGSNTGDIPIITVSAGPRYGHVGEQNVKAFLSKPFDLDTLMVVLEDALPHS